ncbi:hypothetical protein P154DRAFT_224468 [Amniculicola lignicola CBS 123094]|uniref:Uncharacterized protein n=1 Tax=Amniculicola lignicola CBS 123094 TaxID=1392246 RepID=A0A6A5X0C6_9PLEO|nr:hypothetical protein P154DRAFT_224468 [Amniculicola lignicola CBS 123094]
MADNTSRHLLQPYGSASNPKRTWRSKASARKSPMLVLPPFAILCGSIIMMIVVLVSSNKDPVSDWSVQPSVFVALLTGIYTVILSGLFMYGVTVTWWKSIANGTTLKNLHFIHAAASPTEFISAVMAGSEATKVALAALLVFVVRLSIGPISQRATESRNQDITKDLTMNIHLANEIPDGWFGKWGHFDSRGIRMLQDTLLDLNITTTNAQGFNCPDNGLCTGMVTAAGINWGCKTTTEKIDMADAKNLNATLFSIDMDMDYGFEEPVLFLTTKHISAVDGACVGTLTTDICNIIPATTWYPITMRNTSVTMRRMDAVYNTQIKSNYTSKADNYTTDLNAPIGPLEGIYRGIGFAMRSEALLCNDSAGNLGYCSSLDSYRSPVWPSYYLDTTVTSKGSPYPESVQTKCPLVWQPPAESVLSMVFEYMFRASFEVGGVEDRYKQNFTATYTGSELWHFTDFTWMGAATGLMVLGLVAAFGLVWGWWELGRHITLSPLETGKAFGAPILMTAGPEQEADSIVKEIGHERVAFDGDELVWNGTVYATGMTGGAGGMLYKRPSVDTERTLKAMGSMHEIEASTPRGAMMVSNVGGHKRSISGPSTPTFEHNLGASTRNWFDGDDETLMDAGHRRSTSGSGASTPMRMGPPPPPMPPFPASLTPGNGNPSPSLPPIATGGALDPASAGKGKKPSTGQLRPLSLINEKDASEQI